MTFTYFHDYTRLIIHTQKYKFQQNNGDWLRSHSMHEYINHITLTEMYEYLIS